MSGGQRSDVAKLLQRRNDGTKLREKREREREREKIR